MEQKATGHQHSAFRSKEAEVTTRVFATIVLILSVAMIVFIVTHNAPVIRAPSQVGSFE